jgi:hypothetical protein
LAPVEWVVDTSLVVGAVDTLVVRILVVESLVAGILELRTLKMIYYYYI